MTFKAKIHYLANSGLFLDAIATLVRAAEDANLKDVQEMATLLRDSRQTDSSSWQAAALALIDKYFELVQTPDKTY